MDRDKEASDAEAFLFPDDPSRRTLEIKADGSKVPQQVYEFDRVFGPSSTQAEIFEDVR